MRGIYSQSLSIINNLNRLNNRNRALMERLCTGKRINRGADDPAGLAISQKMQGQIRGLRMAQRNVQDGISLIQTGEGAMRETHDILQRMNELAVQAANGTYTNEDREKLNLELQELKKAIASIAKDTTFNTKTLMDGSKKAKGITLQVGPNAGNIMKINIGDLSDIGLNIENVDIATQESAENAINKVKQAIGTVSRERSYLGAMENRLEHTLNNLSTYEENLTAAESRISDADMAQTMMEYAKNQVLMQVSQATASTIYENE